MTVALVSAGDLVMGMGMHILSEQLADVSDGRRVFRVGSIRAGGVGTDVARVEPCGRPWWWVVRHDRAEDRTWVVGRHL